MKKYATVALVMLVTGCSVTDQQIDEGRDLCARYGHEGPAVAECVERRMDANQRATTATVNTALGVLLLGLL